MKKEVKNEPNAAMDARVPLYSNINSDTSAVNKYCCHRNNECVKTQPSPIKL